MNKERWGGNKELKEQIKVHKAFNKIMANRLTKKAPNQTTTERLNEI